tara:strand:- start:205 stop:393 length:189 start_codon:yes stop_codon:yes gene_type:complete
MIELCYKTKKQLKDNIGQELDYIETSLFGSEYKSDGYIVGCNKKRSFFAKVFLKNDKIIKVK